jgi:glyoxalase family protein
MGETKEIRGLHHVTAIARSPQPNVDFYTEMLGLRLVKRTVNFDDPGTYHLYYGDEVGHPGTLITFFPWPLARAGTLGAGQVVTTSFAVPEGALPAWEERLRRFGAARQMVAGEEILALPDVDGLRLELVAQPGAAAAGFWVGGGVGEREAIRGLLGVTLAASERAATAAFLSEVLGFRPLVEEGDRWRYQVGPANAGGLANRLDLVERPDARGRLGVGSVHHVAWRVGDDAEQQAWRDRLVEHIVRVTPVLDRQYFRSIYFHEPGGTLFEIATDPPGFAVDEAVAELGETIRLPPWLEPARANIERVLPPLRVPPRMER